MKTRARVLGTTWALGLALLAGATRGADDAAAGADLKKLQGVWVNDPTSPVPSRWEFDGGKLKSTMAAVEYAAKVTLKPDAAPHPAIEFSVTDGPAIAKGLVAKGIYKIDGDRLTICVASPTRDDPVTTFEAVEGETFLFELRREPK